MASGPYEKIAVKGVDALKRVEKLRKDGGITPVILGSEESVELLEENLESNTQTPEQIIAASEKISFPQWFHDRVAEDAEYYVEPRGEWPGKGAQKVQITSHLNLLTGKPYKEVYIALIPTPISWQVPAYLKAGGWNECPNPEEHTAVFKRWEERYGCKVACVTGDVIEMTVENPPATRETALDLALEQFIYCPDIVHQGVETIENLASTLCDGKVWYFWWD